MHYSVNETLPYYIQVYIQELSRHFDSVVVLSNNSKLTQLKKDFPALVEFQYFENKGYDFGMFYRYIINQDLDKYAQLAIVNDSNILLKTLDHIFVWATENKSDFWGLMDYHDKPWFSTHENNYHIQSHFIVLNQRAINMLPSFLKTIDVDKIMEERNDKKLRNLVINDWEIGMSQYFIKNGLKISSFINSEMIIEKYSPRKVNVPFALFHELVAYESYPVLKKKIITGKKKWYQLKKKQWKNTILNYGNKEWQMDKIIRDFEE